MLNEYHAKSKEHTEPIKKLAFVEPWKHHHSGSLMAQKKRNCNYFRLQFKK
jgi:hypothetical protein